jgi:hypothetical protein
MTDMFSSMRAGDELIFEGVSFFHTSRTPDGAFMAMSSDGRVLLMPDPATGLPRMPTLDMMRKAQRELRLFLRSPRLDDDVRAEARAEEPTLDEIEKRDRWASLRRRMLRAWDREPEGDKPMLSERGLSGWVEDTFDRNELEEKYGRVPCGKTIYNWIIKRGVPGDRRLVDMESRSGRVRRKRRFHDIVIALGKRHAVAVAGSARTQRRGYALFKRSVAQVNAGLPIKINGIDFEYDPPGVTLKAYGKEIFRRECKRAQSADTMEARFGPKARRQEYGGGGAAKEPTRFLDIVEQDSTPFPKYFVVDLSNRVPVGTPTAVFTMDIYTHCFTGWDVSYENPSTATWMRSLAHCGMCKEVPKRFTECDDPALAARYARLADIGGFITGCVLYDNALENIARANEDASGDLCHELRIAGEDQATHKNHVERGHQTVAGLMREVPGSSFDIPLMRKYGYDPEKHVLVTLEEFRALLAEAIALYHTTTKVVALGGRVPLDVWIEQSDLHGLSQPRDLDQFLRCIGAVDYVLFGRNGCSVNGMQYSEKEITEDLLADMAAALPLPPGGEAEYRAKVKHYDQLSFISVWNPSKRRYVDLRCTERRYSRDMTVWLHERVVAFAKERSLLFSTEDQKLEAVAAFSDAIAEITPQAAARERQTLAALYDRPHVRRFLGDSINVVRVTPSPSGMENVLEHDLRAGIRRDALVKPQRRQRGGSKRGATRKQGSEASASPPAENKYLSEEQYSTDTPTVPTVPFKPRS